MTYTPKVGDRVRATLVYEGVAQSGANNDSMSGDVHATVVVEAANGAPVDVRDNLRYLDVRLWSFEKLADPEPEWANGDVVYVNGWKPGYWFDGSWYSADRRLHIFSGAGGSAVTLSDYWQRGEVEILWKSPKAA